MTISKRLRYEILRRDDHTCRYCGASAPEVKLTIDHVVPAALGGTDKPENLVTACAACNSGKSSTGPSERHVAEVTSDALRWAAAMRTAARERHEQQVEMDVYVDEFDHAWNRWTYAGDDGERIAIERPSTWQSSIRHLSAAGLPLAVLLQLVDDVLPRGARDPWTYLMGAAWKTVRELQDRAQEIVHGEVAPGRFEDRPKLVPEADLVALKDDVFAAIHPDVLSLFKHWQDEFDEPKTETVDHEQWARFLDEWSPKYPLVRLWKDALT